MNEQNIEVKQKSNKGLVILVIVLLLLVIGLGGYIVYDKVIDNAGVVSKSNSKTNAKSDMKKENNEVKKLTVSEVNAYLKIVPGHFDISDLPEDKAVDAYSGTKMDINNITLRGLYSIVYNNTDTTTERPASGTNGYVKGREETIDNVMLKDCVKAADFESNLYKMYNIKNSTIEKFAYPGGGVKKVGDYYCACLGAGAWYYDWYSELKDFEQKDGELIIYDDVWIIYSDDMSYSNVNLYSDSSLNNVISNLNNYIKSYNDVRTQEYQIKRDFKGTTFKHVFKMHDDGSYYWYSSEKVK